MGVILSCVSHCVSLLFKKKKNEENTYPLIEVTHHSTKNIIENQEIRKLEKRESSSFEIKRTSLSQNDNNDDNFILFYTPRPSFKNKNVRFSILEEENHLKDYLSLDLMIKGKEKSREKSITSNKSLDFFSCKESDSKRESMFQEAVNNEMINDFAFEISSLKKFPHYQKFIQKFQSENLELFEISPNILSEINTQSRTFYQNFYNEILDYSFKKSFFSVYSDLSFESEFFLGSELDFDNTRIFSIRGEFSLYCYPEEFLYFINREEIIKKLLSFETQLVLTKVNENSFVFLTNNRNLCGCNFLFYKSFFHNELQNICEINFSLNQEEIMNSLKSDKLFNELRAYEFGEFKSFILIKPENVLNLNGNNGNTFNKPKIKIYMFYKINYKQNLAVSFAKFMFSNQIKQFFEKISKEFSRL